MQVQQPPAAAVGPPKKEIYTWTAPWPVYSVGVSNQSPFTIAVGSFIEEYSNKIQVMQLDMESSDFKVRATLEHPYPATRLQWAPDSAPRDLLATSGDYLRLWSIADDEGKMECILNNSKTNEYCAPVTSFDWNWVDPSIIATSSIDTTCTVWDVTTKKVRTQLIAHDKEVYDIAWSRNKDIFATAGADGSLRLFDLRSLEHSTIMYETPPGTPLLRLAWNRLNNFYVAAVAGDSSRAVIIDVRMPTTPVTELPGNTAGHSANISSIAWAPHSAAHICTGGDDSQALIWDLSALPKAIDDPILAYSAEAEVNCLAWSSSTPDWVTISFGSKVQLLRV